jgi:peptidoglycan/LPS O-acetylase OafA/YrhL
VAGGRPQPVVAALESRPVRGLGAFSYSLYLIHAPIVVFCHRVIVTPLAGSGLRAFFLMLLIVVPLCVVAARWFAAVFELPFQRRRGWAAVVAALPGRRAAPIAVTSVDADAAGNRVPRATAESG